ncbi:hypothetical protein [Sediminibacterium goheungense]|uniref:Uncharacterized protein n=1 Tax=Sediminibacterium goheungense TaxID=1086393 RepID=A0A4R6J0M4_9BACT|nr:hypothetical protein [Sediminibacterium goheungense]TDO28693.1 hypothetical protein BC659_0771 [Sediminibacterium goheungense]
MKENDNPTRKEYDLYSNNCGTFATEVASQDDQVASRAPQLIDPRPNSMIEEYQKTFSSIRFDPKNERSSGTWNNLRSDILVEKSKYEPKWMKDKLINPGKAGPAKYNGQKKDNE